MTKPTIACIALIAAACICHAADTAAPSPAATPAVAPAAPVGSADFWTSDYETAKALAAKEGKDLLLDFTGSDWCGWCIKLKKEVFSTPEFEAAAPKQFVLVELDFPQDKTKLSAAIEEQNKKLSKEFGVQGYPSIFLADAKGRPYAQLGYEQGGPTNYLARLAALRKVRLARDAAWAKAETVEGAAKAKLLTEGLAAIDEDIVSMCYGGVIAEIKKLDPADASGIVKKTEFKAKLAHFEKTLMDLLRKKDADLAAALKMVDAFIDSVKPAGEDLQKIMLLKLNCYPPKTMESIDNAIKLLDAIAAVDPTTPTGKQAPQIRKKAVEFKERLEKKGTEKEAPAEK